MTTRAPACQLPLSGMMARTRPGMMGCCHQRELTQHSPATPDTDNKTLHICISQCITVHLSRPRLLDDWCRSGHQWRNVRASHDVVVTCPLATGALTSLTGSGSGAWSQPPPSQHCCGHSNHHTQISSLQILSCLVIWSRNTVTFHSTCYLLQVSQSSSSLRFEAVNKLLLNVMHSIRYHIQFQQQILFVVNFNPKTTTSICSFPKYLFLDWQLNF